MNYLKCPTCAAEFATYRALADHTLDSHPNAGVMGVIEVVPPPVTEPTVPWVLTENDKQMLKRLTITQE